jgi:hypothetical protein
MSAEEIRSGDRWNSEIASALDDTNFGIVRVTRANQHSPWLIFEAGALAKSVRTKWFRCASTCCPRTSLVRSPVSRPAG